MATTVPVQDAITGNEEFHDFTEPLQAQAQFYRALNGRDIALMEQNWDNTGQAAMDNPLGGIKRGWAEIKPVYERLFRVGGRYHSSFTITRCTNSERFFTWSAESVGVSRPGIKNWR